MTTEATQLPHSVKAQNHEQKAVDLMSAGRHAMANTHVLLAVSHRLAHLAETMQGQVNGRT